MVQIIIRAVRLACGTLGLALLAGGVSAPRAADVADRVTRTVAAPAKGVRVDATVGEVAIAGSDRTDVAIEIVRRAPSSAELLRFPASVTQDNGILRVNAVQDNDGRDPRLTSTIVLRIPSATQVDAVRLFEGRVRLESLTSACDVDVRRGAIDAAGLAGRIRLEIGSGPIDLRNASLGAGGMMRLRAFNGAVNVQLAREPENARILALTFNGTITSTLPLTMKDKFGPRFGEATIGSGEPVLSIDVVRGDIAIRVGDR